MNHPKQFFSLLDFFMGEIKNVNKEKDIIYIFKELNMINIKYFT